MSPPLRDQRRYQGTVAMIVRNTLNTFVHRKTSIAPLPDVSKAVFKIAKPRPRYTTELAMPMRQELDPVVFVVDDNVHVRNGLSALLETVGIKCETFKSTNDFLERKPADGVSSCLVLDVRLPGTDGLEFQDQLAKANIQIPIIFITGHGDIPMSVKAMKAGAVEFLTKPLRDQDVLDAVHVALERAGQQIAREKALTALRVTFEALTDREREVMGHVVMGLSNKEISAELGISEVTVKVHRHNLIAKLGVRSVAQLVRIADALRIGGRK